MATKLGFGPADGTLVVGGSTDGPIVVGGSTDGTLVVGGSTLVVGGSTLVLMMSLISQHVSPFLQHDYGSKTVRQSFRIQYDNTKNYVHILFIPQWDINSKDSPWVSGDRQGAQGRPKRGGTVKTRSIPWRELPDSLGSSCVGHTPYPPHTRLELEETVKAEISFRNNVKACLSKSILILYSLELKFQNQREQK